MNNLQKPPFILDKKRTLPNEGKSSLLSSITAVSRIRIKPLKLAHEFLAGFFISKQIGSSQSQRCPR